MAFNLKQLVLACFTSVAVVSGAGLLFIYESAYNKGYREGSDSGFSRGVESATPVKCSILYDNREMMIETVTSDGTKHKYYPKNDFFVPRRDFIPPQNLEENIGRGDFRMVNYTR